MPEADDQELLATFARSGSEDAFNTLVSRYVNLVYSAALRFTRDRNDAEEITQAVFIILARKAGSLRQGTLLGGWLYQAARLTAANFVKTEIRRRQREQEAHMRSTLNEPEGAAWEQIAPLLDSAMGELGEADRNAVVMRYFENKSGAEVALSLKVSEAAAHKRVSRALDKLKGFFARRGVVLSTTIIAAAVSINSVQAAPPALAATISVTAVQGTAVTVSTLALVKGALKIMAWSKAKAATGAALIFLFIAGTATVAVKAVKANRAANYPSIQGAWEGTINVAQLNSHLRLVFNVVKSGPVYSATMESVDQGANAIPVTDIRYDYPRVRLETKTIGGVFEGRLDTNTGVMVGKWKQGAVDLPLTIQRTDRPSNQTQTLADSDFISRAGSDVQGVWLGSLDINGSVLRLALKVAESADGKLQVRMDSLDQGSRNIPASLAYYQKPALTVQFSGINATYEGDVSASGKEIDGTWTQMGKSWPLILKPGAGAPREVHKSYEPASEGDLVGHWKGTLYVKDIKLQLLLDIGKLDDGKFDCSLVSIDQGGVRIPASEARWTPPEAHLEWKAIGATFVGKVQKTKLSGTWQQGGTSFPLSLERTKAE